jgi:hypothetical protein
VQPFFSVTTSLASRAGRSHFRPQERNSAIHAHEGWMNVRPY